MSEAPVVQDVELGWRQLGRSGRLPMYRVKVNGVWGEWKEFSKNV